MKRRMFIQSTALLTSGLLGTGGRMSYSKDSLKFPYQMSRFMIGPVKGYSPHIGVLVSMLNYNRHTITSLVQSMSKADLDYQHDADANTIGALLLHLAAIEAFYQVNTFEGRQDFNKEEERIWGPAMNLGAEERKHIKGRDVQFYLDQLTEIRSRTLEELKKRDDEWLLRIDTAWSKDHPLNTYWKWFHVCEHESHHRGQIAWLKNRLP